MMNNIPDKTNSNSPLGDLGAIIDETNLVPLQGLGVLNSPLGVGGRREDLQFLPISINVTNKKILLVGGGKVATHKGSIMARFVQNVTVISPEFTDEIKQLPFTFIQKEYEKGDLEGYFLVYVVTGNHELNAQIKEDAEALGILTSVCDAPLLCDFVSPAIHKEDNVTISVGTNARDAYQAVYIRNQITDLVKNGTIQINKPA